LTAEERRSLSQIIGDAVRDFRQQVPECIAAGMVDMSTGMLLAMESVENHPTEVIDLMAASTFDLFQGRNVVMIEDFFNKQRGVTPTRHYFQEILVNSDNLVHLFMRCDANQDIVATVVCRNQVNVGMLFAQARMVMKYLNSSLGE
jgi:hypothetical protein